jgi:hypothetical protein
MSARKRASSTSFTFSGRTIAKISFMRISRDWSGDLESEEGGHDPIESGVLERALPRT